jgi:hypothetical protein
MKSRLFLSAALLATAACGQFSDATFDVELNNADKAITVDVAGQLRTGTIQQVTFTIGEAKLIGEKVETFFIAADAPALVDFEANDNLVEIFNAEIEADQLYDALEVTLADDANGVLAFVEATVDLDGDPVNAEEVTVQVTISADDVAQTKLAFNALGINSVKQNIDSQLFLGDLVRTFDGLDLGALVLDVDLIEINANVNNDNNEVSDIFDNLFFDAGTQYIYNIQGQD